MVSSTAHCVGNLPMNSELRDIVGVRLCMTPIGLHPIIALLIEVAARLYSSPVTVPTAAYLACRQAFCRIHYPDNKPLSKHTVLQYSANCVIVIARSGANMLGCAGGANTEHEALEAVCFALWPHARALEPGAGTAPGQWRPPHAVAWHLCNRAT